MKNLNILRFSISLSLVMSFSLIDASSKAASPKPADSEQPSKNLLKVNAALDDCMLHANLLSAKLARPDLKFDFASDFQKYKRKALALRTAVDSCNELDADTRETILGTVRDTEQAIDQYQMRRKKEEEEQAAQNQQLREFIRRNMDGSASK